VSILDLAKAHSQACQDAAAAEKQLFGIGNFTKPVWSESMAVHPSQIPEAMEFNKKHGLHVEFDKHGRPKITSAHQMREYCRAHNYRHYGY